MDTGGDALHFQQPQAAASDAERSLKPRLQIYYIKVIFQP